MTREQELTAHQLLVQSNGIAKALVERRWADVAIAVEFAETELPRDLAMTDPALYRTLSDAITTFYVRGGGALNLEKLRHLAQPIS
jgi:hypothetical protein